MGGANNWRQAHTGQDWMREIEKRVLHEERRPNIRTSSDLLGPGIAPYSIWINDWNADETGFNGYFHSEPGAFNTPDGSRYWMGTSQATGDGFGFQRVTEYRGYPTDTAWPRPTYVRKFFTASGLQRQFSPWRVQDGTPVGMIAQYGGQYIAPSPVSTASNATAWTAAAGWSVTRQETHVIADQIIHVDVEATRTGAAIVRPANGDLTNTAVAVLNASYVVLSTQVALSSGQDGRVAHYNLYSATNQAMLTSVGGTIDIASGEGLSFGGFIPARLGSAPGPATVYPNGWLPCDGTLRDSVDYPDLFLVIGTLYNTGGEPGTQFRLPNLVGKVIKA